MFAERELEEIRLRKEALVNQCDLQRAILALEYQRLRSPSFWLGEAGKTASRHPLVTAVLSAVAGLLAFKVIRRPSTTLDHLGLLGRLSSTAMSLFKLFSRKEQP